MIILCLFFVRGTRVRKKFLFKCMKHGIKKRLSLDKYNGANVPRDSSKYLARDSNISQPIDTNLSEGRKKNSSNSDVTN